MNSILLIGLVVVGVVYGQFQQQQSPTDRLIEFGPSNRTWYDAEVAAKLGSECGEGEGYFDVTDFPNLGTIKLPKVTMPNITLRSPAQQCGFTANVDPQLIAQRIAKLSAEQTRFYKSAGGATATKLVHQMYADVFKNVPGASIELIGQQGSQSSVVVRVPCSQGAACRAGAVILSSHLDSITGQSSKSATAAAPGADDDASGTACVLEAARVLMANADFFKNQIRDVEFHSYAAEEAGLLGSQAVAAHYVKHKLPVVAQIQLDMTGYKNGLPAFITDFTDPQLTKHLRVLGNDVGFPSTTSKCGYACSDHGSWTKVGVPASFIFEAAFDKKSPFIHTTKDTLANLDVNHAASFARFAACAVSQLSSN